MTQHHRLQHDFDHKGLRSVCFSPARLHTPPIKNDFWFPFYTPEAKPINNVYNCTVPEQLVLQVQRRIGKKSSYKQFVSTASVI